MEGVEEVEAIGRPIKCTFLCTLRMLQERYLRYERHAESITYILSAGSGTSFPPASEREARMDDPTPRSRKRRSGTECVFGALVPKRGPLSILPPTNQPSDRSRNEISPTVSAPPFCY